MSSLQFFLFLAIQFIAGIIIGTTSFGGNLFAVPLMTLMMSARDAIVIGCVTFLALIILICIFYWRYLLWRDILVLSIAGILGAPVGSWLLANASMRFLLLAAAVTIVIFLLWQYIVPKLKGSGASAPAWFAWPCGILAGIMSGTVAMGGPPVAFYAYVRHWGKESTIGSLSAAFGAQLVVIIIIQWREGLLTPELLTLSLWGSLVSCIAMALSVPLVKRINMRIFRGMVLTMLALSSLVLFIKGFMA